MRWQLGLCFLEWTVRLRRPATSMGYLHKGIKGWGKGTAQYEIRQCMSNSVHAVSTDEGLPRRLVVSSWNVEGLADIESYQLGDSMQANSADILCMQEVRR